jgi:hypothetical protein
VPSDDLSSIPGLEDKYLRALARHGVTDLRGLVQADREVIYRGMANLRPRPTRDQIAHWQDDARSMLRETAPGASGATVRDASEWQTAASFVVVFSQRQVGDTWERRVEAERTEVEPERNPQVWSGWEGEPICGWMLGQLDQADSAGPTSANGTVGAPSEPAGEQTGAAEPPPAEPPERPALHIDSATIVDTTGRVDVLTAGAVIAGPRRELVAPIRVAFTVSGGRPKTQLRAVTRILRRDPGKIELHLARTWNCQRILGVPAGSVPAQDAGDRP